MTWLSDVSPHSDDGLFESEAVEEAEAARSGVWGCRRLLNKGAKACATVQTYARGARRMRTGKEDQHARPRRRFQPPEPKLTREPQWFERTRGTHIDANHCRKGREGGEREHMRTLLLSYECISRSIRGREFFLGLYSRGKKSSELF